MAAAAAACSGRFVEVPLAITRPRPTKSPSTYLLPPHHASFMKLSSLAFPLSRSSKTLVASKRVAETDPVTAGGKKDMEFQESTMRDLMKAYKNALLDGNEDALRNIEAAICAHEMEKNQLSLKISSITAEKTSGKETFLRLTADLENFRKGAEKDKQKFTSKIKVELVESLLRVVDGFEKAKEEVTTETEKEKKIIASYQGIYKQFVEVLRSMGVSVIETTGKPFDPTIHEAVGREESEKFKEGVVSCEVCRGFFLGEQLLRPAKVKISSGSNKAAMKPADKSGEATIG